MKKILPILFILATIPGCMQIAQKSLTRHVIVKKRAPATPPLKASLDLPGDSKPSINIWIHGTRLLPKGMFKNFFFSKSGLHHYAEIDEKYHQYQIAQTLINSDPALFPAATFYLFGWSGALSFKERENAARTLYADLKPIREEYIKTYGCKPHIRIVSHSHGGNIALLLDQVKDPSDTTFFIDELVLLACPVQTQTMHYACAPTFGKVYSLYSMLDVLQIVDPQGLQKEKSDQHVPLFSERFFPRNEKIEQVAIKINDRSIMHIEFVKLKFLAHIPAILAEIEHWHTLSKLSEHEWATRNKCLCLNTKPKQMKNIIRS
jgi:hypothetical protein